MHIERLTILALWLEAGAPHVGSVKGFDIEVGIKALGPDVESCGTVCCIAGAATQFFGDDAGQLRRSAALFWSDDEWAPNEAGWDPVFNQARELLELDEVIAEQLFIPATAENRLMDLVDNDWLEFNDPVLAGRVIRNLIATGEVNWEI